MDNNTQFVPLHLHSEFSLLDGAIKLKDLCNFAKENNMPAVAITDHGEILHMPFPAFHFPILNI